MTWVWVSPTQVDFGVPETDRDSDERTVWLHANAYEVLELPPFADEGSVRRAYRRLARRYHPDVSSGTAEHGERFREVQQALAAIDGNLEIVVDPDAGTWWRFAGFSEPGPSRRAEFAVIGLTFEITDRTRVPLDNSRDDVRVSCANQRLPLTVSYTGSRFATAVVVARLGAIAESAILTLFCVSLIPIIAVLVAVDMFVISDMNLFLTWTTALVILVAGYGAFAAVLTAAGKPVPDPRRAVFRTRAAVATLRSLSRGRS